MSTSWIRARAPLLAFGTVLSGAAAWHYRPVAHNAPAPMKAICVLDNQAGVKGIVTMTQVSTSEPTLISARLEGLKPGKHGFHIHEKGNLSQGCITAGPHFNPFNSEHGGPLNPSASRHVGDLGNLTADASGVAQYEFSDPLVQLSGEHSVLGRSIVVHADEDDLGLGGHADSKTTGHAGARVVCGVIGRDY